MRNLSMTILWIAVLALCGCAEERSIDIRPDGDNRIQMTVRVPSLSNGMDTRAGGGIAFEEGENTVKSLYLIFFHPSDGQYLNYINVPMPDQGTDDPADDVFEMNIDTSVNMDKTSDPSGTSLDAGNSYHILALANVSDNFYVNGTVSKWISQWSGMTENEVMASARAMLPSALSSTSLLMHGRMEKKAGEEQIHLLLERDVVRFDVVNSMRASHDLVSASIWNGYTATSIWESAVMDYSSIDDHTRFHYTVNNEGNIRSGETETDILDDIKGGLYAFENQVTKPESHDNLTTCLIVGLRNRSDKTTSYYRVNMANSASGAQALRRNNVYTLTITGVADNGDADEETAYLGKSNNLIYTVGNWNMDDNGLVVRDDYSLLSIPTKTVIIGKDARVVELSIHTFSTLPSPAPLTVRSQTYRPVSDDIQASLDGNTLKIDAKKLEVGENERSGVIVISYAGLEISLSVVQSGVHDDYLYVTLPDGGIPRFPAYAGISSGLITVQATGPWTAKLYMEGFSFNPSTALAPVKTITSADNMVIDDPDNPSIKKFRVYTHSFNTTDQAREELIVVTLDKDPDTYTSIVRLSQANVKKLYVKLPTDDQSPAVPGRETASAIFNGVGDLATGIMNNSDQFFVIPGRNDNGEILKWGALLTMNGLTDDSGYFEIVESKTSISDLALNYVTVKAKGLNMTGRELKATLRVQTDPGTFADITLIQQPSNWNVPHVSDPIAAVGGETAPLTLDAYPGMHYIVEIESVSGTDHFAYVAETAGGAKYSKLKPRDTGESFVVGFPKMIYPNLYSPISATVKVTIVESGQSKTFSVVQMPPTQHTVNMFNVGYDWGGLSATTPNSDYTAVWGYSYNQAWAEHFHNTTSFGPNGVVKINTPAPRLSSADGGGTGAFPSVWSIVKTSVRFVHFTRPGEYSGPDWIAANTDLWKWILDPSNDGVLLVNAEDDQGNSQRQFSPSCIPGKMKLSGDGSYNATYSLSSEENRVMDYLTKTGPFGQNAITSWTTEGVTSRINLASVKAIDGAVPVFVNGDYCALMVDPKRRIVVKTDSEMLNNLTYEMNGLGQNLQAWLINTAQYGTHFSEYFWNSPRVLMTAPQPQE